VAASIDATVAMDTLMLERFTACTCCGGHQGLQDARANIWWAPPADGRILGVAYLLCRFCVQTGDVAVARVEALLRGRYGIKAHEEEKTP
jgi:hypothetical protein